MKLQGKYTDYLKNFNHPDETAWRQLLEKEVKEAGEQTLINVLDNGIRIPGYLSKSIENNPVNRFINSSVLRSGVRFGKSDLSETVKQKLKQQSADAPRAIEILHCSHFDALIEDINQGIFEHTALFTGATASATSNWNIRKNRLPASGSLSGDLLQFAWRTEQDDKVLTGQLKAVFTARSMHPVNEFAATVIHGGIYRENGASPDMITAFMLAQGIELIEILKTAGISPAESVPLIALIYPCGTTLLQDIAAIRALKVAWQKITASYGVHVSTVNLHTVFPFSELSATDRNTNLLRLTTAAMTSIAADTGSILLPPFDGAYSNNIDEPERITLNIIQVLLQESRFGEVSDALGGSYVIERLTRETGRTAWNKMQEILKEGGWLQTVKNGTLTRDLLGYSQKRQKRIREGTEIKIGLNKYLNTTENSTTERPFFTHEITMNSANFPFSSYGISEAIKETGHA
jgi:methylmalonyl-CoA mutase